MNPLKFGIMYRTYKLVLTYAHHRKTKKLISDVFYGDDFRHVLNTYLNMDVDVDWLGRLYGVINPNVDIDGNFNASNVIIEIDGERTNTDEYVKTWLMKQLNLMGQLFKMKNLYSYITMDIDHIGPINHDNYLVVFDIVTRQEYTDAFKKFIYTLLSYAGIASIVGYFLLR